MQSCGSQVRVLPEPGGVFVAAPEVFEGLSLLEIDDRLKYIAYTPSNTVSTEK